MSISKHHANTVRLATASRTAAVTLVFCGAFLAALVAGCSHQDSTVTSAPPPSEHAVVPPDHPKYNHVKPPPLTSKGPPKGIDY